MTGADGSQLMLKANGGPAPLEITDSANIPAECRKATIELRADEWLVVRRLVSSVGATIIREDIAPDNGLIREALAQPCNAVVNGMRCVDGWIPNDGPSEDWPICTACGGSGKNAVPGARLRERSKHLEIRYQSLLWSNVRNARPAAIQRGKWRHITDHKQPQSPAPHARGLLAAASAKATRVSVVSPAALRPRDAATRRANGATEANLRPYLRATGLAAQLPQPRVARNAGTQGVNASGR